MKKEGFIPALFLGLLLSSILPSLQAQDMHFGHFFNTPLIINPARSGQFDGEWRLHANYRDQWRSITVPYSSYAFSGDYRPQLRAFPLQLGAGLYLLSDRAGDGNLNTQKIYFSAAVAKYFEALRLNLSFGAGYGNVQQRADFSKYRFDRQWTDRGFDPQLATGEKSGEEQYSYRDLSLGLYARYRPGTALEWHLSYAVAHSLAPRYGFYNQSRLGRRHYLDGGAAIRFRKEWLAEPAFFFSWQRAASELLIGGNLHYYLQNNPVERLSAGIWWRASGDAIPAVGLSFRGVESMLSYDFNLYDIRQASKTLGGFELSMKYIIGRQTPVRQIVIPCIRI